MSYIVPDRDGAGGDRLDRIARAIYGSEGGGNVEALLVANPGLADLAAGIVPAGTVIRVPVVTPVVPSVQRVWQ